MVLVAPASCRRIAGDRAKTAGKMPALRNSALRRFNLHLWHGSQMLTLFRGMVCFNFGGVRTKSHRFCSFAGTAQDARGLKDCAQGKVRGNNALNQEAARCGKHWNNRGG